MSDNPDHVIRTDQTIVAWDDVPVGIQKKILSGTMTEEDWNSDWDYKRGLQDIVSPLLSPVDKEPKHVHVFRKEYPKCMLKGCGALRSHHSG